MSSAEPKAERSDPRHDSARGAISTHVCRAHADGRARYGDLPLDIEHFAARVHAATLRRLRATAVDAAPAILEQAFAQMAGADLFLAIACDEDVPGAWQAFTTHVTPHLRGLAMRRGATAAEADDLAHELPAELCMPPPGGDSKTRLGTFDGAGSLHAWLGVIVRRRLADRRRAPAARMGILAGESLDPAPAAPAQDPVVAAVDAETSAVLEQGLRAAWENMTPRERIAVDLRFRRGIAQSQIARVLQVGEPRVSRILDSALVKLRREVGRRLDLAPRRQWDLARLWQEVARALESGTGQSVRQGLDARTDSEGTKTHA